MRCLSLSGLCLAKKTGIFILGTLTFDRWQGRKKTKSFAKLGSAITLDRAKNQRTVNIKNEAMEIKSDNFSLRALHNLIAPKNISPFGEPIIFSLIFEG